MNTYILINVDRPEDPVLGVYDSELLAMKMELYFKGVYPHDKLKIFSKYMEYIDRD